MFQAISSALFKKIGKNAAILNDSEIINNLNNDFYNLINSEISENNLDYEQSKFFKLYYESGRYNNDNINFSGDTNMKINLSGSVKDLDGDILFNQNTEAKNSTFGTYNIDHKINVYEPIGIYNINIFISLKHDDRF